MTTNHPEKLDDALIRPGRVDHQVAFSNATQTQIRELFERMYTNDLPHTRLIVSSLSSTSSATASSVLIPPATPLTITMNGPAIPNGVAKVGENQKGVTQEVSEKELSSIAEKFASKVPSDTFSPAEIQGFLLKRKKDPRKALVEVEAWVESMVEQKKKGTKLVTVQ
jgi:chaperone BCS1